MTFHDKEENMDESTPTQNRIHPKARDMAADKDVKKSIRAKAAGAGVVLSTGGLAATRHHSPRGRETSRRSRSRRRSRGRRSRSRRRSRRKRSRSRRKSKRRMRGSAILRNGRKKKSGSRRHSLRRPRIYPMDVCNPRKGVKCGDGDAVCLYDGRTGWGECRFFD